MFCNNCGTKLPDGSKFCNECGYKLNPPHHLANNTTDKTNNSQKKTSLHIGLLIFGIINFIEVLTILIIDVLIIMDEHFPTSKNQLLIIHIIYLIINLISGIGCLTQKKITIKLAQDANYSRLAFIIFCLIMTFINTSTRDFGLWFLLYLSLSMVYIFITYKILSIIKRQIQKFYNT